MRDFTVRLIGRLVLALIPGPDPRATLWKWAERLFPAKGKHRATPVQALAPAEIPRPVRPLPNLKRPLLAREETEKLPFLDTLSKVRPYVLTRLPGRQDTEDREARSHQCWVTAMALRGFDVGPSTIHGVHVQPGTHTERVMVAA
ncbi:MULTISPECIES: hypothetical protein [unclassified Streptomyces]|uniref:hypothetical protein n=1 Tax=unclassified Streptomyces TaxID=2593676 RepID=UPI000B828223|nr:MULTISPECIES: hypothetical protein [unclassified Streptomyces]